MGLSNWQEEIQNLPKDIQELLITAIKQSKKEAEQSRKEAEQSRKQTEQFKQQAEQFKT